MKPALHTLWVKFTAPNAYGVDTPGAFKCEYLSTDGHADKASQYSVYVNGLDSMDWMA